MTAERVGEDGQGAPELLQLFHEEAEDLLSQLESTLLALEADPGKTGLLDDVFRLLHTLKGTCSMYGFEAAAGLAHEVETLFDRARSGTLPVTGQLVELALATCDALAALVIGSERESEEARRVTQELMDGMQALIAGGEVATPATASVAAAAPVSSTFSITLRPRGDLFLRGVNLTGVLAELASLGELTTTVDTSKVPGLEQIDPEQCYLGLELTLACAVDPKRVHEALMFLTDGEYLVERVAADGPSDRSQMVGRAAAQKVRSRGKGVRVAPESLDELVDLVGELVTAEATLRSLVTDGADPRVADVSESFERLAQELRQSVLGMRMVPIGSTFGRFARYVRDLSKELGKDVVLVTEGSDAELDRSVIERIEEPLLHIIRNCIDHGIEAPVDRRAAGKPETGTITLSAFHSGGSIYVRVSDDGRGIDLDSVRAKAVADGRLGTDEQLDRQKLADIVTAAGFSTAAKVTSVSGRGVGLDAVRRSVEDLQGSVEIDSTPGSGVSTTIRLPLTLAIIEGLLVAVGAERYVIPLSHVAECVELAQQEGWEAHGRHLLDVRGEVVPFVRLREFFAVAGDTPRDEIAVIAEVDGQRVAVVVDWVVDRLQVVIKTMGRVLRRADAVIGGTLLGDGSIALIVDVGQLQRMSASDESDEVLAAAGGGAA